MRIGHGTAVMYEDDPLALLREMAAKKVLVEVALSSADLILGVKGNTHPLLSQRLGAEAHVKLENTVPLGSFKLRGKRVFKMAPLQHHFELLGWDEVTIVIRFWIIAGLCVVLVQCPVRASKCVPSAGAYTPAER